MTNTMTLLRAPVPRDIMILIAAVTVGGTAAGFLGSTPLLFLTTPLVAAAMALAGAVAVRVPEWRRAMLEVLERLPDGQAKVLLNDVMRRASTIPDEHVTPLVDAACDAALQLSALDLHVAAFRARPPDEPRRRDAYDRCRRGAELLTQRLEDASAALSRWQAAQGAGENLGRLARELNEESRYQQEAAQEVEALLGS